MISKLVSDTPAILKIRNKNRPGIMVIFRPHLRDDKFEMGGINIKFYQLASDIAFYTHPISWYN
jgi:hypothetical protein